MHEHELGTVLERTILTPAERAVLVEQASAIDVLMDNFVKQCKEGSSADAIQVFISMTNSFEYITNIINTKIGQTIARDHDEGREH